MNLLRLSCWERDRNVVGSSPTTTSSCHCLDCICLVSYSAGYYYLCIYCFVSKGIYLLWLFSILVPFTTRDSTQDSWVTSPQLCVCRLREPNMQTLHTLLWGNNASYPGTTTTDGMKSHRMQRKTKKLSVGMNPDLSPSLMEGHGCSAPAIVKRSNDERSYQTHGREKGNENIRNLSCFLWDSKQANQ